MLEGNRNGGVRLATKDEAPARPWQLFIVWGSLALVLQLRRLVVLHVSPIASKAVLLDPVEEQVELLDHE